MPEPLVSVLIPSYNSARWLGQAIESALAQSWSRTEIIVVNDGSSDRSLEIARGFECRGVQVIDQPNRGAAAARNVALRAATGDYIQFLDADDILGPDKVSAQLVCLADASPTAMGSGCWARFMTDPTAANFLPEPNWRDMDGLEFVRLQLEEGWMMQPGAWLVPRAVADRIGPWNEDLSLNDDGEYFARAVLASSDIRFCTGARVYYRSGSGGNLSARRDRRALESLYRSCDLIASHVRAHDSSPRTTAAVAHGWKRTALELYPDAADLSRAAEAESERLGGSSRSLPGGRRFQALARVVGWRVAKRLLN